MGIGVSIFLIAVGAIVTFAVDAEVAGVDLEIVGFILMGAGVLGLLLSLLFFGPRRRTTVEQRRVYDDGRGAPVEERRRYDSGGNVPPP